MPSISTTSPPDVASRDSDEWNCKSRDNEISRDNEKSRDSKELDSKSRDSKQEQADYYYSWVHSHIIKYQTPALGLFPRRRSSYVTDNVYCGVVIWALSKVIILKLIELLTWSFLPMLFLYLISL